MKRFSMRENLLLMAPVVLIGALGFWASRRPMAHVDDGKPQLTFRIQKPTTLQAFQGATGTFVIGLKQRGDEFHVQSASPYFEVQTASSQRISDSKWRDPRINTINGDTFPMNTRRIPLGALSFGCKADISYSYALASAKGIPGALFSLSGKWKVDRAQIEAPNLAAWPRKPLISLREVKVTRVDKGTRAGGQQISGEAIFRFEGRAMTNQTPLELSFSNSQGSGGTATNAPWSKTPRKARHRITEWTVYPRSARPNEIWVTGRASANNRWPLGFEIEPFSFKTVKIGQKLKFKQFPVPLPKN